MCMRKNSQNIPPLSTSSITSNPTLPPSTAERIGLHLNASCSHSNQALPSAQLDWQSEGTHMQQENIASAGGAPKRTRIISIWQGKQVGFWVPSIDMFWQNCNKRLHECCERFYQLNGPLWAKDMAGFHTHKREHITTLQTS